MWETPFRTLPAENKQVRHFAPVSRPSAGSFLLRGLGPLLFSHPLLVSFFFSLADSAQLLQSDAHPYTSRKDLLYCDLVYANSDPLSNALCPKVFSRTPARVRSHPSNP